MTRGEIAGVDPGRINDVAAASRCVAGAQIDVVTMIPYARATPGPSTHSGTNIHARAVPQICLAGAEIHKCLT
jgi:hypothetical protein